jgi:hypothetical protein
MLTIFVGKEPFVLKKDLEVFNKAEYMRKYMRLYRTDNPQYKEKERQRKKRKYLDQKEQERKDDLNVESENPVSENSE